MMKRILFSFFWLAPLSINVFSQEKFTIHADFPDDSYSGHVIYISKRFLPYEGLYETNDSIILSGTHFYYEGQLKGEPFLGVIGFDRTAPYRNNTNFVAEPGEIRVVVSEWEKAGTVSGTRLNDDYQTYISDFHIRINEIVQPLINERKAKLEARNWTTDDEAEYGRRLPKDLQSQAVRSEGEFMEKYLDFPEVLTPLLWTYMNREFNPFEHVINRLPEVYQKRLYAHQARMNRGVEELKKSPDYDPTLHEPVEIIPDPENPLLILRVKPRTDNRNC